MLLINCKVHLELNLTKDFVMSNIGGAITFKITNTNLYVPLRPVYWNECKKLKKKSR